MYRYHFFLRSLGLAALAVWFGGFTFYSAVVVPVLHDALGNFEAGAITRRVTVTLNQVGVAAVAVGWVLVLAGPRAGKRRTRLARLGLLAVSSAILIAQIVAHREMDRRLDAGALDGFYPLHRAYLIASTVQWFANLGLLALAPGPDDPPRGDP